MIMKLFKDQIQMKTLPLSSIDDCYECYRLIDPKTEKTMKESMDRYGQFSPVVVGVPAKNRYLLVDGFKRFRACRKLGHLQIKAGVFEAGERALKAAMFHLNRQARSMRPLEEAMIVYGLYRKDKLTQVQIGTLLGFHKSWVCRRIALVERLNDEVFEQVRLGLIGPGMTRELIRLPRGNQADTLRSIQKHQMTCRETAKLVRLLLERPRWEHDNIFYFPKEILSQRQPDKPPANEISALKELSILKKRCKTLLTSLQKHSRPTVDFQLLALVNDIGNLLQEIKTCITETYDADF
jgi:ParB/RepB/Spo0J family partition protein